eukprot:Platyproteum_vivax@DN5002_c0_g1_i1.p1
MSKAEESKSQSFVRAQRNIFLLTYVCYVTIYFTRKPLSVIKGRLEDELELSAYSLGALDTSYLTFYAIGQFVISPLGDVFGPKYVLFVSYLGSAIFSICFSLSSNVYLLNISWGLNGLFQASVFPLMIKALVPWLPQAIRGQALGVWTTSQQLGGVVSTALAVCLMDVAGWRMAVMAPSFVVFAFAFVILFTMAGSSPVASSGPLEEASSHHSKFLTAFTLPGISSLGIGYFCIKLVRYTMMFWLPFYISTQLDYSDSHAGYLATFFDFGGILGSILCGYVCDVWSKGRRIIVVFWMSFLTGVCALLYGYMSAHSVYVNAILMFLLGAMVAGPDSVLGGAGVADVCEACKRQDLVTTAGGIVNGLGSVGAICQGVVTALMTQYFGWNGLFQLLSIMCVLTSLVLGPLAWQDYLYLKSVKETKES